MFLNGHLETIYPALFRKVILPNYEHERISTPDDDFLDLVWLKQQSSRLVILCHGLEGDFNRPYVMGMARACYGREFDVLAWNYRGCGDFLNRQLRFYHSGDTDDLELVIQHALRQKKYTQLNLVGFSLGGNIVLKYLGERGNMGGSIHRAVTFSVPMDLYTSCQKISTPGNWIYAYRFLRSLKSKVIRKSEVMRGLDVQGIGRIKTIMEFDDRYTAPLHGFKNAREYYAMCSSIYFADNIQTPTLIVNAQNDPFLSMECFPAKALQGHPAVQFESPAKGGHVGFTQFNKNGLYWSEERALEFLLL